MCVHRHMLLCVYNCNLTSPSKLVINIPFREVTQSENMLQVSLLGINGTGLEQSKVFFIEILHYLYCKSDNFPNKTLLQYWTNVCIYGISCQISQKVVMLCRNKVKEKKSNVSQHQCEILCSQSTWQNWNPWKVQSIIFSPLFKLGDPISWFSDYWLGVYLCTRNCSQCRKIKWQVQGHTEP